MQSYIHRTQEGTIEVATVLERFTQQNFLTVKYQPNNNGQSGNYVSVLVDASYRGRVCGICGELSGDQIMDLSGPRQCMYTKPELLIASYRYEKKIAMASTQNISCNQPNIEVFPLDGENFCGLS